MSLERSNWIFGHSTNPFRFFLTTVKQFWMMTIDNYEKSPFLGWQNHDKRSQACISRGQATMGWLREVLGFSEGVKNNPNASMIIERLYHENLKNIWALDSSKNWGAGMRSRRLDVTGEVVGQWWLSDLDSFATWARMSRHRFPHELSICLKQLVWMKEGEVTFQDSRQGGQTNHYSRV